MPDVILKNVAGMAGATSVPVLNANRLTECEFKTEYVAQSCPCIIRGAVSHWPAIRRWHDREYLKCICGRHEVPFWPHENHVTRGRIAPGVTSLPFADAIDKLYDAGREEVAAIGCTPGNPEMAADLAGFPFFKEGELGFSYPPFRFFFFNKAGSSWHYHSFDETLMCQVVGSKKVGLLKVENSCSEEISRIFFQEDYYEDASIFDTPAYENLPWRFAELGEGDALYIPPLWWHGIVVTSLGVGVTVPVSWRSPDHVIADSLKKMAVGRLSLNGIFRIDGFRRLLDVARKLGLEHELEIGWKRGLSEQQVSLVDQHGARKSPVTWPPM